MDQTFRRLASDGIVNLEDSYAGKVILVVNTASKCGNTPQYEGLEKLYQEFGDQGLVVLGFPSNDFFGQEPGTEQQIQDFCRLTYSIKFPMFEKVTVK
ncbi:MAG: glutathione peroxidase, partial [Gammaproteobacteria bacterium]|nr:glutathione peroxidase [Gammaproteobacteria bacterium]